MIPLQRLDENDPVQDSAANLAHDRKYGWRVSFPREYTNIARNPEYQAACPQSWYAGLEREEDIRQKIWDWHNREKEVLVLKQPKTNQQSARLLFA